jgi:hypothetical protein
MRRVEFFNHLDTGSAILGNLVDVRPLHQPQANVDMAKAMGGAPVAFAVEL